MKKIDRILLLIGILVISLCGCTNQNDSLENGNENNISNVQKNIVESNVIEMNDKSGDKYSTKIENLNNGTRYSTVKSDFKSDIVIGDNYYATQIADISMNFDSYEGKTVEIEGFSLKNNYGFTFVGRYSESDICPDCPTGYAYFEYEWHGDEPLNLGVEETWVKVKGELKTGNDGVEYRYIDAYSIEVMDEWGVATVKN